MVSFYFSLGCGHHYTKISLKILTFLFPLLFLLSGWECRAPRSSYVAISSYLVQVIKVSSTRVQDTNFYVLVELTSSNDVPYLVDPSTNHSRNGPSKDSILWILRDIHPWLSWPANLTWWKDGNEDNEIAMRVSQVLNWMAVHACMQYAVAWMIRIDSNRFLSATHFFPIHRCFFFFGWMW